MRKRAPRPKKTPKPRKQRVKKTPKARAPRPDKVAHRLVQKPKPHPVSTPSEQVQVMQEPSFPSHQGGVLAYLRSSTFPHSKANRNHHGNVGAVVANTRSSIPMGGISHLLRFIILYVWGIPFQISGRGHIHSVRNNYDARHIGLVNLRPIAH